MSEPVETNVVIEPIVTSENLQPEEINERVGLACDRSWRIGDKRGQTGKTWATCCWVISEAARSKTSPLQPSLIPGVTFEPKMLAFIQETGAWLDIELILC